MKVELISKTLPVGSYSDLSQEELISAVARHGKIKEDNGKLVKYLIEHGHWSPLQFLQFTFAITTSRAISAQLFRHRSLNHQELSQRYDVINEYEPIDIRRKAETNRQSSEESFDPLLTLITYSGNVTFVDKNIRASDIIEEYLAEGNRIYSALLEEGVAKETARMILPMASQTKIHLGGNLRDWLAFLNQRCDQHAQKEARDIAMLIGEAIENEIPNIMKNISWRQGKFM